MTTITTSPSPQLSRTPLLVGLGIAGVVAVTAVVVPKVLTQSSTTSATTTTSVGVPSLRELDSPDRRAIAAAVAAAQAEHELDLLAKSVAHQSGSFAASVPVIRTETNAQVGGGHLTYPFTGRTGAAMVYNGCCLVPAETMSVPIVRPEADQQIPGKLGTYPYNPAGAQGKHTVWNDSFVPPYDDPAWAELIHRHYYGTSVGRGGRGGAD